MGPRVSRPALENCLQDLPGVKIDSKQVEETEEILGSGAYGEVIVALYNGVRYASKKLHEALVENDERISPNDPNSPVRKFREECQRMSQLRHPNIVQFIGVYFKPNAPPCLLMELLPICLANFLEDKSNIGFDRKCFILLDVAKGLLCLHSHSPPIIHRDLTANNVLLTSGLKAKIADFGVARYLPLPTETGGQYMTICPGNLNYMPPEAKKENALYDTKLDIFSFGHLTMYVATMKWPILTDKSYENPVTGDTEYRTEIERRNESLQMMTKENLKLRQLAVLCLQDDANQRPMAKSIIELLTKMIPDTKSKSQTLLDEMDQLKQKLQAKMDEVEELKKQLAILRSGPLLKITGNLPLECTQEADGSLLIRLNPQATVSTDPCTINHVETRTVTKASSNTTNTSAELLGTIINGEQPKSPALMQDVNVTNNSIAPAAVPLSGLMYTDASHQSEITDGSVKPQNGVVSGKPSEPSKIQTPIQQIGNKSTPPIPVPRVRTLPRGHTSKAEIVKSTKASTNPIEALPLSVKDQRSVLPATLPRLNTVGQLGQDTLHIHTVENGAVAVTSNSGMERQRSQTLPRRPPTARKNLPESGGATTELQALLAKRRQWEQK